jgi:hypothetical protein
MDPITQRILDQQRAITQDPNFSGYEPSNINGIAAINTAPVNENLMVENNLVEQTPPIDVKGLAKNVGKNLVTDFAIKKLGLEGLKGNVLKSVIGGNALSLSNPLTAAFTVGSLLPDSVKGIAGILRNNRAQKAIERDIIRDMQGKITTSNPRITNMQPTNQDIYRGGGGDGGSGPKTTSTKSTSKTQSRHTSGAGGLHSGY